LVERAIRHKYLTFYEDQAIVPPKYSDPAVIIEVDQILLALEVGLPTAAYSTGRFVLVVQALGRTAA